MITTEPYGPPIPLDAGNVSGWKAIKIEAKAEPLVPLGPYAPNTGAILTSSVYYGEHASSPYTGKHALEGALISLFVRKSVARRLLAAQGLLPQGYRLLVFDAYRPLQVQASLFHQYYSQLHQQRPDLSEDELSLETQKYVSIPSADPIRPSPHNTGGAVDLAIVRLPLERLEVLNDIDRRLAEEHLDANNRIALEAQKSVMVRLYARMLNFGTAFDHGGERAAIAYFEEQLANGTTLSTEEMEACNNRRLLYNVMTQAGMQAYKDEWWHFNAPESQMGAAAANLTNAAYGAAALDAGNIAHEEFRRKISKEAMRLRKEDPRAVANPWPIEAIRPYK